MHLVIGLAWWNGVYLYIEEESAFGSRCESEPRALQEDFHAPTGSRSPGAFTGTLANWCRPSVLHTTRLSCLGKSRLLPFPATILLKDFYQQKQPCRDRHQWWLLIRAKGTQNPRFAEDLLGSHHDDCLGLGGSHLTATAFDKVSVQTVALWMRRSAYQDYQRDWDVLRQSKAFQELFSSFGSKASCMVMITTTTPLGSSNASRALCILASTEKTGTAILERGFGPAPFIQY